MPKYIEPPQGLFEKILEKIHKEERLLVLRRIFLFALVWLFSVVGMIYATGVVANDLARTGFLHSFSLIFSDFSSVFAYWPSFLLLLLKTLPVIGLAIFLSMAILFLQSAKFFLKNVKIIKVSTPWTKQARSETIK